MKKKIFVITIIILILTVPAAVLIGLFPLLQSPRAVNKLAAYAQPITGIYLHVDDIYLDRHLGGHISGLQIREMKEKGFVISLPRADIKGSVSRWWKINIEKMVLADPKFIFYLKKEKSETNPLETLKKLPRVHLLEVKNGRLDLKADATIYSLSGMNMSINDFNPEGGGHLGGKSGFIITSGSTAVEGSLETALDLARFSPAPHASGSFRIILDKSLYSDIKLDNGAFTSGLKLDGDMISLDGASATVSNITQGEGEERLAIKNIEAHFNASYDQKTSGFSLTSLEISGADIGLLKGGISVTANPLVWNASLHTSSLDIARISGLVKPLLPDNYRDWTFKGKSGFQIESRGRQEDDALLWEAKAIVDLREGGFASPDSSKAAEKMNSRIEFNLDAPGKGRKGGFNLNMNCAIGEFLWGTYYQDFKGKKAKISAQGAFAQKPFSLSLVGTGDLFQTGNYKFSADMSPDRNLISLNAKSILLTRLFSVAAQNYISQNYSNFKDLKIEGDADLKLTALISDRQKMIEGDLALRGIAVRSPANSLKLTGLNVSLPYDLAFTGTPAASSSGGKTGAVAFDLLEKDNIRISKFAMPVVFSGNRFILPDPINAKIFDGEISLAGFRAENLLRPEMRAETGIVVRHINIEQIVEQEEPVLLSGMIDGKLPSIIFQNGKWTASGALVAQSFGGQIKIENIFVGRLFSASQFFGADAGFDHIDLEKLTSSLKVGRMTGLIKGSLKNFSMEYGQPSSFDLVIETDTSRSVPKLISVDAINNLSIISTGSGAISAILNSGVNQFFKDYPYSQIGMRCTLKDDIFKLRGLVHDSGKEYLVRKALFRGVDIVNQNPDNYISFKDMAERMSRITKSQKETKNVP
ncbi:MAG: hypothetical protein WA098_01745 [Smithella sp.]